MPYRHEDLALSRLLLDEANARLGDEQPSQQAAAIALAKLHPDELVALAEDIVEDGLDPISIPAVVQVEGPNKRYRVLEGNRRVLALKALETPNLVKSALPLARYRKLVDLAATFARDPVETIRCVVFDSEDEVWPWVELRHTGANNGVGLVQWNANEQDRFKARHGSAGNRTPAGQILDFVELLAPPEQHHKSRIISTITRLISTKAVRDRLGFDIDSGIVFSHYPAGEIFKSLHKIVDDFRSDAKKVTDIYYEQDRLNYIQEFPADQLPDPSTRLEAPLRLDSITTLETITHSRALDKDIGAEPLTVETNQKSDPIRAETDDSRESQGPADRSSGTLGHTRSSHARIPAPRSATIPRSCVLRVTMGRIRAVYHELLKIEVDQFPNACAVLLRVFIELSLDSYIEHKQLIPENQRLNTPLPKRLTVVAKHLRQNGVINTQVERTATKIAEGSRGLLSASSVTFNQYVHNQYVFPQPAEIRSSWDEIEPIMRAIWPKEGA